MITHRRRVVLLAAPLLLTGCGGGAMAAPGHSSGAAPAGAVTHAAVALPGPFALPCSILCEPRFET